MCATDQVACSTSRINTVHPADLHVNVFMVDG